MINTGTMLKWHKIKLGIHRFSPAYAIGFLRPDKVRGEAWLVFWGSVAIKRN
jgi:hypothetical protein